MFNLFKKKASLQELQTVKQELAELVSEMQMLKAVSADSIERYQLKNSEEPWIDLVGGDVDFDKGLQLKLDWNDAFITQLRAQGYKGTSEGALVAQYLLVLGDTLLKQNESQG